MKTQKYGRIGHNKPFLLGCLEQRAWLRVNGATQGAGEAPAIDAGPRLLYTPESREGLACGETVGSSCMQMDWVLGN